MMALPKYNTNTPQPYTTTDASDNNIDASSSTNNDITAEQYLSIPFPLSHTHASKQQQDSIRTASSTTHKQIHTGKGRNYDRLPIIDYNKIPIELQDKHNIQKYKLFTRLKRRFSRFTTKNKIRLLYLFRRTKSIYYHKLSQTYHKLMHEHNNNIHANTHTHDTASTTSLTDLTSSDLDTARSPFLSKLGFSPSSVPNTGTRVATREMALPMTPPSTHPGGVPSSIQGSVRGSDKMLSNESISYEGLVDACISEVRDIYIQI